MCSDDVFNISFVKCLCDVFCRGTQVSESKVKEETSTNTLPQVDVTQKHDFQSDHEDPAEKVKWEVGNFFEA